MVSTTAILRGFWDSSLRGYAIVSFFAAVASGLLAAPGIRDVVQAQWPGMSWLGLVPSWLWPLLFIVVCLILSFCTAKGAVNGYIRSNPEMHNRYKLWDLYRLLAAAGDEQRRGGFSSESVLRWNEQVEKLLREWNPGHLENYRVNLNEGSSFKDRADSLKEVLDAIVTW